MEIPSDGYLLITYYFDILNRVWNVILANWLLSLSVLLIFVSWAVSLIKRSSKGGKE